MSHHIAGGLRFDYSNENWLSNIENMDSAVVEQSSQVELGVREERRVYLITYSQADTTKVSSRQRFAEIVLEAFQLRQVSNESTVQQWACCLELHQTGGIHFHMAIKLRRPRRWLSVRQFIHTRYRINVHFSNRHVNYYTAWSYVIKKDNDVVMSSNHPDLWNTPPPVTTAASEAIAAEREHEQEIEGQESGEESSATRSSSKKRKRPPHLTMFDVFFFFFIFLFKHISNCLPQKHLGLSRGLTIIH